MLRQKLKAVPPVTETDVKASVPRRRPAAKKRTPKPRSPSHKTSERVARPDGPPVPQRKRAPASASAGSDGRRSTRSKTGAARVAEEHFFSDANLYDPALPFGPPGSGERKLKPVAAPGSSTSKPVPQPSRPGRTLKGLLSFDKKYNARVRDRFPDVTKITDSFPANPFLASSYGYKSKRNGKETVRVVPAKEYLSKEPRPTLPPHPLFRKIAWTAAIERLNLPTNKRLIEYILSLPPNEQAEYFHLFDGDFYSTNYSLPEATSPIVAFLTRGIFEGQCANPFLNDNAFWLRLTREVCVASTLTEGYESASYVNKAAENFKTTGFLADLERRFDVQSLNDWECLDHYLQSKRYRKWKRLIGKIGALDHSVYRELNPDLRSLSDEQLSAHYEEFGREEKRIHNFFDLLLEKQVAFNALNERFDWRAYKENNMDLHLSLDSETEILAHYIRSGFRENRPVFRTPIYFRAEAVANYEPFRQSVAESSSARADDIKVLFHVFNQEEVGTYTDLISTLKQCGASVYVNVAEQCLSAERLAALVAVGAKIFISKNAGRDFGGFLHILENVEVHDDDIAVLLHTKRSVHVTPEYSRRWVNDLKYAIGPSVDQLRQNIDLMRVDKTVMAIGPIARYALDAGGKNNRATLSRLLDKLGIDRDYIAAPFITGTMGLYRGGVLNLMKRVVNSNEFEPGQPDNLAFNIDGQIAHSLERLLTIIAFRQGRVVWR